jgi:hypothetical protein
MGDRVSVGEFSAAKTVEDSPGIGARIAAADGAASDLVLAFQRGAGNAAVARVLAREAATSDDIDLSRRIPLTPAQASKVNAAEAAWRQAHVDCLRKFLPFMLRALRGDEELRRFSPEQEPKKTLGADDAHIVRGLEKYMSIYPSTLDFRPPVSEGHQRTLVRLAKLTILLMQVASRVQTHLFYPVQPPRATTAAKADTPMTIFPAFFEPWTDELAPAKAIMHEYFHYLFVPGERQQVYHGSTALAVSGAESALMDAYSLSNFVMWLGVGREVESI